MPRTRPGPVTRSRQVMLWLMAGSAALVIQSHAENWPQFRGANSQGVTSETRLPLHWSATDNVAWKTAIPGESWSSPVVWGNQVFLTTATENGESCRVLALDARTGVVQWNREVSKQVPRRKEGRNSYATPTPATDGKRVYTCFGDGTFVALTLAGKPVWENRDHKFYSQHGLGTSPILHQGLLIMARDGSSEGEDKKIGWQKPWDQSYVVALDTRTGREKWKTFRGQSRISHGTPAIWTTAGGKAQVISEAGDVLQGFDALTGQRLWTSQVLGEGKVPSMVLGGGLGFTTGGWGGKESIKAFRLGGSGDLGESNLVWEQRKGIPKVPSLIYLSPYVYGITDGGIASCLKAESGEIVWQERIGGNFSASPVATGKQIFFLGDNGDMTVVAAGPEFKVLAKNSIGETLQATPALARGHLYLRTDKNLFCIGPK